MLIDFTLLAWRMQKKKKNPISTPNVKFGFSSSSRKFSFSRQHLPPRFPALLHQLGQSPPRPRRLTFRAQLARARPPRPCAPRARARIPHTLVHAPRPPPRGRAVGVLPSAPGRSAAARTGLPPGLAGQRWPRRRRRRGEWRGAEPGAAAARGCRSRKPRGQERKARPPGP